jgi:hypothetical protein
MATLWHGTLIEYLDLANVLNRNCGCRVSTFGMGRHEEPCSAHRMLVEDQRALNGLLFARWLVPRLRDEEWLIGARPSMALADQSAVDAQNGARGEG